MAFAASPAAAADDASSSPRYSTTSSSSSSTTIIPPRPTCTLLQPPSRPRHGRRPSPLRLFRSICRTLPIFTAPRCRLPSPVPSGKHDGTVSGGRSHARVTGTLFGHLRGRVSLCVQESPGCLPWMVIEMAVQTQALMREMGMGMVRIALECEGSAAAGTPRRVMDEGMWALFYNGRKSGYAVRREATERDLSLMELLRAVSVGAGVLPRPDRGRGSGGDGEVAYMRAYFEHVAGSRDSETLYLLSPVDNNGPELTIFFVRI